ncbi:YfdX family protein, partial [Salmonella enterica subsp. enterica serovar Anatum]|nr:YfdX family protein [Salmonella enterica subsp. enterica serovar Anatum]
ALKLAGVSVIENQELIPLQQTRKDVTTALSLMNEGKYYQAGLIQPVIFRYGGNKVVIAAVA